MKTWASQPFQPPSIEYLSKAAGLTIEETREVHRFLVFNGWITELENGLQVLTIPDNKHEWECE